MTPAELATLTPTARKFFDAVKRQWAIKDEPSLSILFNAARALDRATEARALIAREGLILQDRFGQAAPHPACRVEKEAVARFIGLVRLLNLDLDTTAALGTK